MVYELYPGMTHREYLTRTNEIERLTDRVFLYIKSVKERFHMTPKDDRDQFFAKLFEEDYDREKHKGYDVHAIVMASQAQFRGPQTKLVDAVSDQWAEEIASC